MDAFGPFIFAHTGRISEKHSENEEAEWIDIWLHAAGCSLASSLEKEGGYDNMQQVSGGMCYTSGVLAAGGWNLGKAFYTEKEFATG